MKASTPIKMPSESCGFNTILRVASEKTVRALVQVSADTDFKISSGSLWPDSRVDASLLDERRILYGSIFLEKGLFPAV